jgi:hypothetical protein
MNTKTRITESLVSKIEKILEFATGKTFEFEGEMYALYDPTVLDLSMLALNLDGVQACAQQGNPDFRLGIEWFNIFYFNVSPKNDLERIVRAEKVRELFTSTGKEEGPILAGTDHDGARALKEVLYIEDVISVPIGSRWVIEDINTNRLNDLSSMVKELKDKFQTPIWVLLKIDFKG